MHGTKISFMEANLVMNRHFDGFSHGIPLQSLEQYESFEGIVEFGNCVRPLGSRCNYGKQCSCYRKRWDTRIKTTSQNALWKKKNTWRFFFRSIPKIIDNSLYIARFFTITGPLVSEERLKRIISSMSIPICRHLIYSAYPSCCHLMSSLPKRYLRYFPYIQPERPYLQEDGKAIKFDPEQDSCLLCSTDYHISLNRGISDNETNLNISIYHCLGPCRSPNDTLWESFSSRPPRFRRTFSSCDRGFERGSFRRKWHEASIVEGEVEVV